MSEVLAEKIMDMLLKFYILLKVFSHVVVYVKP